MGSGESRGFVCSTCFDYKAIDVGLFARLVLTIRLLTWVCFDGRVRDRSGCVGCVFFFADLAAFRVVMWVFFVKHAEVQNDYVDFVYRACWGLGLGDAIARFPRL